MLNAVESHNCFLRRLLDLVRTSHKGKSEPIPDLCRLFNEQTEDGNMLKSHELSLAVLRSMDKATPFLLLFKLHHGDKRKAMATYKLRAR